MLLFQDLSVIIPYSLVELHHASIHLLATGDDVTLANNEASTSEFRSEVVLDAEVVLDVVYARA